MKKFVRILSILLMLVICISAVACGSEGDESDMNNPQVNVDERTKVGDKITLGKYEQNGDGGEKEAISWTVIKVEEGRALLLADKCLAHTKFHETYETYTWEYSDMRYMLNNDFYLAAFDDAEKALIEEVALDNGENYVFSLGGGNETKDKVFLLSLDEAKELLTEDIILGVPTDAVKKTASLTHGTKSCNWWLRTEGSTQMKSAVVGYNQVINYPGLRGDIAEAGVRPCVWYKTETNADPVVAPVAFENISSAKVGDKTVVGEYEGEAITWTVAAIENGKVLLVADKAVDAFVYHTEVKKDANWSNSTLKLWLNGAFMNKTFDDSTRARISTSTIVTKGVNGGDDITVYNQLFILSAEELLKYFPERESRMITPTAKAIESGVYTDPIYGTCDYWVREAGTTEGNGAYVYYYGDVNEAGALARSTFLGVRPAMWIMP